MAEVLTEKVRIVLKKDSGRSRSNGTTGTRYTEGSYYIRTKCNE